MTHQMTETEALNEAVLLLVRKTMRLAPEAYAKVVKQMPAQARQALTLAENQADQLRDQHGVRELAWPVEELDLDEE